MEKLPLAASDWQTGGCGWSLCFSRHISVFAEILVEILCEAHVIEDSTQLFRFSSSLLAFFLFTHLLYSVSLQAISNKDQHSISYTLSRVQMVVVEYTHDSNTDMFQVACLRFDRDFRIGDVVSALRHPHGSSLGQ